MNALVFSPPVHLLARLPLMCGCSLTVRLSASFEMECVSPSPTPEYLTLEETCSDFAVHDNGLEWASPAVRAPELKSSTESESVLDTALFLARHSN